ncbi:MULTISPECIES: hypothetical protein [unclassified Streptomyces]|uniref:hypothetical protein n=1 Tax=unclassified Streptomyces TaxID=2593676 RepID=UPI000BF0D99F|nr:hypothetical protein [Streptomyces sp. b84]
MTSPSQEEIGSVVRVVSDLHMATVHDEHARAADHAAASLCSGAGLSVAPPGLHQLVNEAIQIGYATALNDVRDGDFDDDIREWRPDLSAE